MYNLFLNVVPTTQNPRIGFLSTLTVPTHDPRLTFLSMLTVPTHKPGGGGSASAGAVAEKVRVKEGK